MKFNFGLTAFLSVLSWGLVALYVVAVEVLRLDASSWLVLGIIGLVAVVAVHLYIVYVIIKNRKRILMLQDQYVETFKPDAPLRFCPTDEQLMKAYVESRQEQTKNQADKKEENTEEKTQSEEEELEMN